MSTEQGIKKLKVVQISSETLNAKSIVLEPIDWHPIYHAGQFITFNFKNQFGEKRRSYSISSSSELDEPLTITFKRIENGEISRPLFESVKVGDLLYSSGISGFFTLPEKINSETRFCFLAAGSGITPCFSLIKALLFNTNSEVLLIYSNKNHVETIFYDHLLEYQERFKDRFIIRFLFSDSNNIYTKRFSRWLLDIILEEHYKFNYNNILFYLCGPFEYMQTAEIALRMHTPKENIIKENFSYLPRIITPTPPDKAPHKVIINYENNIFEVDVEYPDSILAAAKKKNINLPYSCEAGRCGSCAATCTNGKIWMAYNEVLVDNEIAKGRILTCQSFPIDGDAEITIG